MSEIIPHQLLVLGRGINTNSSNMPGVVAQESEQSVDSYERAVTAAELVAAHTDIELVVFSGSHSFALPAHEIPDISEARAMSRVAITHGLDPSKVTLEEDSMSTYANFIKSRKFFDRAQPIGVVAHRDHMDRALEIGSFVLPDAVYVPYYADRVDRPTLPNSTDRLAKLLYGIAMVGVLPGDHIRIAKRDRKLGETVSKLVAAKTTATSWRGQQKASADSN